MDLLDQLQLEHLDGEQRQLAEAIGIKAYIKLLRAFAGAYVYVPTIDTVTLQLRDKLIREEYNGYNALELAKKWGLSERWVRSITEDVHMQIKRRPLDGQVSFL